MTRGNIGSSILPASPKLEEMKRTRILNQYRTEEGRKHWKEYAAGSREYGTRYNLMAFSCRADLKTTAVMAGGHINHLLEMYEKDCGIPD